ncbi:ribbon-helix-helix domain-containing protein [Candidatus Bipolaricaulota bacterium]|nr:ribbon-helix-helix domain-containing protein [Candidatus Bipolaricaulota bacterium]
MLKTYAAKLEEQQIEGLRKLSKGTKIPQAELLRQAVDLLLERWRSDQERLEFIRRLDRRLEEDREAMERLAKL